MTTEPTADAWIPACDLCGSLRYEQLMRTPDATALRCRDCGLVSFTHSREGNGIESRRTIPNLPEAFQCAAMEQGDAPPRSTLVIGVPTDAVIAAARTSGTVLTVLVEPGVQFSGAPLGSSSIPGVGVRMGSLESAAFPPESFDLIIVTRGADAFPSPSLLFDRARLWLAPEGRLFVGALNYDSLPARLRRGSWVRRYAQDAEHLFTSPLLCDYARRFGFNPVSVRTRSKVREVAAAMHGSSKPGLVAKILAFPVSLIASTFGMGVFLMAEMKKGSLQVRPALLKPEEAAEAAPGLAPAMYTGVQMREVRAAE